MTTLGPSVRETIEDCKNGHLSSSPYFSEAERDMAKQWKEFIWPGIQRSDFTSVLEIACGHGRNSERLSRLADNLTLVDVNEHCVEACRKRFGERVDRLAGGSFCRMRYVVTDGASLPGVEDASITLVYSWDSMVHFDTRVVAMYLRECARVMKPGATGFIHHSNLLNAQPGCSEHFRENTHWRSRTSAEQVAGYVASAGLELVRQSVISWHEAEHIDCVTRFRKPR
jgi:ubiquinone/menaquinone biosynthesis C-methylase UbiE